MEQSSSGTASRGPGAASARTGTVGTVTMVAGGLFAVGALVAIATDWGWLGLLAGMALLIYAVPQLHRMQAPADGWAGRIGAPLVALGAAVILMLGVVFLIWEAVGEPAEPAWVGVFWLFGSLSFLVGIVLFCIGSAVARVLPPGAPLLALAGLLGALIVDMATGAFFDEEGSTTEWGFYIGLPLFGLGLAWMGYAVRSGRVGRSGERIPG